jgi:uncharacterized membrane protein YeaQ/YmgE (transglycosylase-associated protein family)
MNTFEEITFAPIGLIAWVVAGLVAGLLASVLTRQGYGVVGDMILGLVGAMIGGFLFGMFASGSGVWGSIVAAFLAAWTLIGVVRVVTCERTWV